MTNQPSYVEDVTPSIDVRAFGDLQQKLRALAYNEPVGAESVPLVKRLLTDFVAVSESKTQLEQALAKAQREALDFSQILLPLRKENAALTRENNSLHLELIHQEEAIAEREKRCQVEVEGLKDELKKLQFVNGQKTQQCSQKEQEIMKLQAQLERLMSVGVTMKQSRPLQPSSIEMKGADLSIVNSPSHRSLTSNRRASLENQQPLQNQERVQNAQIVARLQEQLSEITTENEKLRAECENFNEKLQKREQEISRLSKLSVQMVNNDDASVRKLREQDERYQTEAMQQAAEIQIEQLTTQVDYLNDQVAMYERRLKDTTNKIRHQNIVADKLQQAELSLEKYANELNTLKTKYHMLEEEHLRCGNKSLADKPQDGQEEKTSSQTDEIQALKEQIHTLSSHRDRLEDALRATHYDKISYTNALSNANSHNRVLSTDLDRAESKLKELTINNTKLQQALIDAQSAVDTKTRELDVVREALKQSEENRSLETEKNASLHRELRSMDKVLAQRDEECRSLNRTLVAQKAEVERLNNKLDVLSRAIDDDSNESGREQSGRKAVFAQEMKWLEEERQELRSAKEECMAQVMSLEEELQKAQTSLAATNLEKDKLLEKMDTAIKLQRNLEEMLEAKKKECLHIQKQHLESKEEIRRLVDQRNQAQVLLVRADDTENEKIQVQNEALTLKRRVEELRDENVNVKNRAENAELYIKRLLEQLQSVQEQVTILTKTNGTLDKEKHELQNNYDSVMNELRNARLSSNHYQSEYEKLSKELLDQQQTLSSGQSALQTTKVSLSELKNQVLYLQSELKMKQSTMQQLQTRLDQEKLGHKNIQSQLVLVQDELLQAKEVNRARELALKQLRDELQAKDRTLTEKTEALENFKLLVEQMESSRDQIVFKMKQQQQQIQRYNQESDDLHTKVSTLEKAIMGKNAEITSLKKLTRTLDNEKDLVHDQLDALTEKYHELEQKSNELRQASQSEVSTINDLQGQMGDLVNRLNEREDQVSKLRAQCAQLEDNAERLEHLKAMQEAEMSALTHDLENMTIENQALSEECTRMQFTHQTHNQSVSSLKLATREVERERDALQIELDDLRHTYRSLIQEHEGMQRARAQVAELQEELTTVNEALRKQVATLENELEVLRQKNITLTTEGTTYRDQVTFLTQKLKGNEEHLAELEATLERVQQELETQKRISTEISAQRYGAQAENATVSQRIVHLEAKLSNNKYEAKALSDNLQAEQTQRRNLENLVSTLRQKIAEHETMISHLQEQRETMAQEIQAFHQRRAATSPCAMDVSELNHTPPSRGSSPPNASPASPATAEHLSQDPSPAFFIAHSQSNSAASPATTDDRLHNSGSSILPLRSLEIAQVKVKELEDRLTQQDETIKQLERSRSKFKRFAAKYEREIEQRDRLIEELQSSNASSLRSPGTGNRSVSSVSSSASEGSRRRFSRSATSATRPISTNNS